MKMRVIPTPIYVEFMNAIGANAVPMPFTETYTALEQGAIDGMTNPLLNIADGKYNEVSKHLTLTNHMYTPQAVIVSKKFWDKLSADEKKILQDAASETAVFQRKVARDEAAKALEELKKARHDRAPTVRRRGGQAPRARPARDRQVHERDRRAAGAGGQGADRAGARSQVSVVVG